MYVTIDQIAAKTGVSPGTVSRILNAKNKENRPTMIKRAKRIRKIAAELGYRPNLAARQMVRGRFDLIAFLNCGEDGRDWFPRRLLHGLHDMITSFGSRLAVTEIPSKRFSDPHFAPDVLRESMVDGIVAHLGVNIHEHASSLLDASPLPVVYVNHDHAFNSVYPDEISGGEMITCKLIQAGHRHIGFLISGGLIPDKSHFSEYGRVEGYQRALRQAGIPTDRYLVKGPRWDVDNTVPPILDYLDRHPDLTAIIVYKLELAIALREAALQRRRLDRLTIAVFNDGPFHSMTGIPMATVIIPFHEVGVAAAEMVRQRIEDPKSPSPSVVVPYSEIQCLELIRPPVKTDL